MEGLSLILTAIIDNNQAFKNNNNGDKCFLTNEDEYTNSVQYEQDI